MLLVVFEALWVLLFAIVVTFAPEIGELGFFLLAIICLTISAVELTLGLLVFIVYYHVTNYISTGSFKAQSLQFYIKELRKTKLYTTCYGPVSR
jgi:NADH:ubiquinone oxidoreductase subunit K